MTTPAPRVRTALATALVIFGLAWFAPPPAPALAQLPGSLVVTVSSPAAGSTVSGATTVSASASDNVGVVGVQFKLDGANLGAEDTTAPHSISWDTTGAS